MTRQERKRLRQLRDKCWVRTHIGTGKFIGFHNDGDAHIKPYAHYDEDTYELIGGTEAERHEFQRLYREWLGQEMSKSADAFAKVIAQSIFGLGMKEIDLKQTH